MNIDDMKSMVEQIVKRVPVGLLDEDEKRECEALCTQIGERPYVIEGADGKSQQDVGDLVNGWLAYEDPTWSADGRRVLCREELAELIERRREAHPDLPEFLYLSVRVTDLVTGDSWQSTEEPEEDEDEYWQEQ